MLVATRYSMLRTKAYVDEFHPENRDRFIQQFTKGFIKLNCLNKEYAELIFYEECKKRKSLLEDSHNIDRLKSQKCKYCYYNKPIESYGQAFVNVKCKNCGLKMAFSNEKEHLLCNRCARLLRCCAVCGGKRDI